MAVVADLKYSSSRRNARRAGSVGRPVPRRGNRRSMSPAMLLQCRSWCLRLDIAFRPLFVALASIPSGVSRSSCSSNRRRSICLGLGWHVRTRRVVGAEALIECRGWHAPDSVARSWRASALAACRDCGVCSSVKTFVPAAEVTVEKQDHDKRNQHARASRTRAWSDGPSLLPPCHRHIGM